MIHVQVPVNGRNNVSGYKLYPVPPFNGGFFVRAPKSRKLPVGCNADGRAVYTKCHTKYHTKYHTKRGAK